MPTVRRLLTATLLAALGAAGTAHAAPAPGINVSAYADSIAAADQGAKQVRFFVPWRNFEPSSSRDFTKKGPGTANPLTTDLKIYVDRVRARGVTPVLVLLDAPDWAAGGGTDHKRPRDPAEFADWAGELADWLRDDKAPPPVYEVWNEPDAPMFWGGAPDIDAYTALLKAAYPAMKAGDPHATVLMGPTTGNNFGWVAGLYARGAKDFFDGVAVHTDTACSIVGPDVFYRDAGGRLGQFTFLAYREIRKEMLANGDGDKGIWMTEIGWETTQKTCTQGEWAGKKLQGVQPAEQAAFLTKAFQCMANDPYVVAADWFTMGDDDGHHYGLFDTAGLAKPALAAFKSASQQPAGECGDFTGPALSVAAPVDGQQFVDKLDLKASATDPGVGIARITYAYDGGKSIRNFTDSLVDGGPVGLAPWQGSGALALGPHTVEVTALDKNGNTSTRTVQVTKVAAGSMAASMVAGVKLAKSPTCKKAKGAVACSWRGALSPGADGAPSVGGKVAIEWQWKNKQRKFRKLVGGLKAASAPFTFTAKLKKRGTWRVRLVYGGQAPYKPMTTRWVTFKV